VPEPLAAVPGWAEELPLEAERQVRRASPRELEVPAPQEPGQESQAQSALPRVLEAARVQTEAQPPVWPREQQAVQSPDGAQGLLLALPQEPQVQTLPEPAPVQRGACVPLWPPPPLLLSRLEQHAPLRLLPRLVRANASGLSPQRPPGSNSSASFSQ